jgi:fluoroquinolone transport system permease protein
MIRFSRRRAGLGVLGFASALRHPRFARAQGPARRLGAALAQDLRLQWRHGFWFAYAFVCLSYVLVLQLFAPQLRELLTMLVLFADPAVLGFFFIGGLMLLERGDGTLPGNFASPLRIDEWMLAKLASLTLLAIVASFAIALPLAPGLRPGWLLVAIVSTSSCFVVIGIVAGTRFSTVNRYLLGGGLATTPLLLPMLAPLGVFDTPVFHLLPTGAAFDLLALALGRQRVDAWIAARALVVLCLWTACVWAWARAWMRRYVLGPEGA